MCSFVCSDLFRCQRHVICRRFALHQCRLESNLKSSGCLNCSWQFPFKTSVASRGCRALKMLVHLDWKCLFILTLFVLFARWYEWPLKSRRLRKATAKSSKLRALSTFILLKAGCMIVSLASQSLLLTSNKKLAIANVVNPSFDQINVSSARNLDDFGVAVA